MALGANLRNQQRGFTLSRRLTPWQLAYRYMMLYVRWLTEDLLYMQSASLAVGIVTVVRKPRATVLLLPGVRQSLRIVA